MTYCNLLCSLLRIYLLAVFQFHITLGSNFKSDMKTNSETKDQSLYEALGYLRKKDLFNVSNISLLANRNIEKTFAAMLGYYTNFVDDPKTTHARRSAYLCLISWFYEYFKVPVLIITDSNTEDHVNEFIQKQSSQITLFSYQYTDNTMFRDVLHWKVEGYKLFVFLCSLKCYADIITMAANADLHDNKYIWVTDKSEVFSYINPPENMLLVDVNSWHRPSPTLFECSYREIMDMLSVELYRMTVHKSRHLQEFSNVYYLDHKKSWLSLFSEGYHTTSIYLGEINFPHRKRKTVVNIVTIIEPPFTTLFRIKPKSFGDACRIGKLCWVYEMLNATLKVKVQYCCIGFCMDLLHELEKDLNVESNVYLVEDSVYGVEINGTYNGLIGDVIDGKADAILAPITIYQWRSKIVDFSEPYLTSGISIGTVIRHTEKTIFNFDIFSPLSLNLWISTFAISMTVSILLWHMEHFLTKENIYPWKESILYQIGLVFQRDMGGQNPIIISTRIIALCVAIFMMILMSSYTAMLTAKMVTYSDNLPITGFKDNKVVNPSNDFIFATIAQSGISKMFRDGDNKGWKKMHKFMQNYNFINTTKAFIDLKSGKLNTIIHDTTVIKYFSSIDQDCSIQSAGDPIPDAGYAIALPKGSPWKTKIDNVIREYKTREVIKKLEERWLPNSCLSKSQEHTIDQAEINSFGGLFVVLIAACFLAIAIFVVEHVLWRLKHKTWYTF